MNLLTLLKGKLLVTVVASIVLVGGATVAFAATSAGQTVVQSLTQRRPTASATATPDTQQNDQGIGQTNRGQSACPGLPQAQKLATSYHLSTASQGDAVKAICALHLGTFQGTTSDGIPITANRVYGYGEIDQLLTYAQYLAAHDTTNPSGTLTDANARTYLATALHNCGSSPLATCLQTHIPKGNKPTATPTPHS